MADTLKKVLTEYGVDMKKTMERFVGDEDLYAECLTKFLSDSSWPLLKMHMNIRNTKKCLNTPTR